jgi:hypothetical protein
VPTRALAEAVESAVACDRIKQIAAVVPSMNSTIATSFEDGHKVNASKVDSERSLAKLAPPQERAAVAQQKKGSLNVESGTLQGKGDKLQGSGLSLQPSSLERGVCPNALFYLEVCYLPLIFSNH